MATNLAIDDELLTRALQIGGLPTKRETVNQALAEFIARRKRVEAAAAFGTVDFDERHDDKAARRKR
ncbi:MAG: type II toxin-antitoxin system VapB family antitoxin [Deltaproteobacteria bacterium]|nr:type II toxin-antitoxin system VapB family antitoxin [Nannocystaceae bacterium]